MAIDRDRITRCPRLGGEVPFSYCEREAGELPCRQVIQCWGAVFPVEAYLRETLGPAAWVQFSDQAPQNRLTTLLGLAEAASKRRREEA